MTARLLLVLAVGCLLAPWVISCGDDDAETSGPPSDTKARAREVAAGFHVPDPDRIPSKLVTNPGRPWGDYTGSEACKRCHADEYRRWRGSFHSRTLYDAIADTVMGDFTGGTKFDERKRAYIVEPHSRIDADTGKRRFFMDIRLRTREEGFSGNMRDADTYGAGTLPDLTEKTFEVIYAFGNRRHQPYVVRDKAGQHWVAPVYWDAINKAWEWDGWRPYVRSCGNCHLTGIRTSDKPWYKEQFSIPFTFPTRYNLPPQQEQWAEGAVGCEVCHGPGRKHIRAVERVGVKEYRRLLAEGKKEPSIYNGRRATFDQRLDACGQCHNFFTESSCTWTPGPKGFARDANYEPLEPKSRPAMPDPNRKVRQFYVDGSHMSPCTAIAVYKKSLMYKEGVGCWDCHESHGTDDWADLILPIKNNELCISCHDKLESIEAQTAHSRHPAGGPGNRCVECHMPRILAFTNGVKMMSKKIHSHSFGVPTGIERPGGPPSSCRVCHDDRSPDWVIETLAGWAREKAGGKADK